MTITVLIEDSKLNDNLVCEHGLSLFVETESHKVLFDAGATDKFAKNAKTLGIDLKTADVAVLSHGHYDHGGGLTEFAKINSQALIYIKDSAFEEHLNGLGKNIGIDRSPIQPQRIVTVSHNLKIDEELYLFSDITGRRFYPHSNLKLKVVRNGIALQDDYIHEQCLAVKAEKGFILFSGCAHNGIINIIDTFRSAFNEDPYAVISGFHLVNNYQPYSETDIKLIKNTAEELSSMKTLFYTGHCTGNDAFQMMKQIMPNNLFALSTGLSFKL